MQGRSSGSTAVVAAKAVGADRVCSSYQRQQQQIRPAAAEHRGSLAAVKLAADKGKTGGSSCRGVHLALSHSQSWPTKPSTDMLSGRCMCCICTSTPHNVGACCCRRHGRMQCGFPERDATDATATISVSRRWRNRSGSSLRCLCPAHAPFVATLTSCRLVHCCSPPLCPLHPHPLTPAGLRQEASSPPRTPPASLRAQQAAGCGATMRWRCPVT